MNVCEGLINVKVNQVNQLSQVIIISNFKSEKLIQFKKYKYF